MGLILTEFKVSSQSYVSNLCKPIGSDQKLVVPANVENCPFEVHLVPTCKLPHIAVITSKDSKQLRHVKMTARPESRVNSSLGIFETFGNPKLQLKDCLDNEKGLVENAGTVDLATPFLMVNWLARRNEISKHIHNIQIWLYIEGNEIIKNADREHAIWEVFRLSSMLCDGEDFEVIQHKEPK
ncbi:hypothetical protein HELRODRAFT_170758 [Helobdella robusta]|uniref:Uncharacterized protein n=1 Tax=Helobdella robusta TaxID=6412 RepID=T1F3E0_HELRO|nr:hypothetical protein HELRODRAFT_170758 [Helobdella robusta]ESO07424.1 hypothetical protein HELRODRAFT_170758 [Helobdella robusta]